MSKQRNAQLVGPNNSETPYVCEAFGARTLKTSKQQESLPVRLEDGGSRSKGAQGTGDLVPRAVAQWQRHAVQVRASAGSTLADLLINAYRSTVDARTMSAAPCRRMPPCLRPPSIMLNNSCAAAAPRASIFMSTVVSGGSVSNANTSQLSYPVTATSSGIRRPASFKPTTTPAAI